MCVLSTYLGKTFSFPVTMIEGGLDTLDKVEAGDVDAEDALEFGVKMGEENTDAGLKVDGRAALPLSGAGAPTAAAAAVAEGVVVDVFCRGVEFEGVVGVVGDDDPIDGDDKLGRTADEGKPVVAIGMSRPCRPPVCPRLTPSRPAPLVRGV